MSMLKFEVMYVRRKKRFFNGSWRGSVVRLWNV